MTSLDPITSGLNEQDYMIINIDTHRHEDDKIVSFSQVWGGGGCFQPGFECKFVIFSFAVKFARSQSVPHPPGGQNLRGIKTFANQDK